MGRGGDRRLAGGVRRGAGDARPPAGTGGVGLSALRRHVVVGAGTAGFNAITTLCSLDPDADVTLVSSEPPYARMVLPYYLSSEIDEANVYTISPEQLAAMGVRTMFGQRVSGLDRAERRVLLDSGERIAYDDLLIATGSSAVRPRVPGIGGRNVYDHWTLADTQALRSCIRPGSEVAIVGAGFIAFTIVNPLLHAGCQVKLIEREPHVLPRMLNAEAAQLLEGWVGERGISVFTHADLRGIEDTPTERKLLRLAAGESIEAGVVIVATGIRPNLDWLQDSGLEMAQGLLVDGFLRTSDPAIFAAGDVAEVIDGTTGRRSLMAIETAAMEQGRLVGAAMAGQPRPYDGGMLMNVVEVADFQAASFGDWQGDDFSEGRASGGHYRRYLWRGDRLVGGVIAGPARRLGAENDMGMLKGLVQTGQPLGVWRDLLVRQPFELKKVFLATRTAGQLLESSLLGTPSLPLEESLAAAGAGN